MKKPKLDSPEVVAQKRRAAIMARFYEETRIALNDEHARLIADFVHREKLRAQIDVLKAATTQVPEEDVCLWATNTMVILRGEIE